MRALVDDPTGCNIDCARCLQARSTGVRSPRMARDTGGGDGSLGGERKV